MFNYRSTRLKTFIIEPNKWAKSSNLKQYSRHTCIPIIFIYFWWIYTLVVGNTVCLKFSKLVIKLLAHRNELRNQPKKSFFVVSRRRLKHSLDLESVGLIIDEHLSICYIQLFVNVVSVICLTHVIIVQIEWVNLHPGILPNVVRRALYRKTPAGIRKANLTAKNQPLRQAQKFHYCCWGSIRRHHILTGSLQINHSKTSTPESFTIPFRTTWL